MIQTVKASDFRQNMSTHLDHIVSGHKLRIVRGGVVFLLQKEQVEGAYGVSDEPIPVNTPVHVYGPVDGKVIVTEKIEKNSGVIPMMPAPIEGMRIPPMQKPVENPENSEAKPLKRNGYGKVANTKAMSTGELMKLRHELETELADIDEDTQDPDLQRRGATLKNRIVGLDNQIKARHSEL